jgi:hypothetical protein
MASELETIAGLYGAIDREIVSKPAKAAAVAELLGAYRDPKTIGWYARFAQYVADRTSGKADLLSLVPEVPAAALTDVRLSERDERALTTRKLLALSATELVFEEYLPGGAEELELRRALVRRDDIEPMELEELANSQRIVDLHLLLATEFRSMEQWPGFVDRLVGGGYVEESFALQAGLKPCYGELVPVEVVGDEDYVACMSTCEDRTDISYDDAKAHLQPDNWAGLGLWCTMQPARVSAAGNPIYHEIVSLNCADQQSTWTVETELEFAFTEVGTTASSVYRLPADLDTSAYPDVVVDEGWLSVEQRPGGVVRIESSKRVKFQEPFDSSWFPMLSCAFGYGSASTELIAKAAEKHKNKQDVPFKGSPPPGGSTVAPNNKKASAKSTSSATSTAGDASGDEDITKLIKDSTAVLQKCVDDSLVQFKASYQKVVDGTYTANDWIGDMTNLWKAAARDSALMVDYGIKASQALAEKAKDLATDDDDDDAGHAASKVTKAASTRRQVAKKKGPPRPGGNVRKGGQR